MTHCFLLVLFPTTAQDRKGIFPMEFDGIDKIQNTTFSNFAENYKKQYCGMAHT